MGKRRTLPDHSGPAIRPLVTRGQIWSISVVTGVFLAVAMILLLIVSHVVLSMRGTANAIDDERATAAAAAAVAALERRLSLTVRDNALWDEAYDAVTSDKAQAWILDNWGIADYPLYDGVIVVGSGGAVVSAYLEGEPFDPLLASGAALMLLAGMAREGDEAPVSGLARTGEGIAAAAAMPIRRFDMDAAASRDNPILILLKVMDEAITETIAKDYQIAGLTLQSGPLAGRLNLALKDVSGARIGHLSWPSRQPGDRAFERLQPMLVVAGAILVVFLLMVLAAGVLESLRLRRIAAIAEYEAKRDPLSGMLNRSGFMEALEGLAPNTTPGRPLALHMLDLDGFKQVNDTWGHAVGDILIAAVSVRIAGFQEHFAAIGRLGGDEFALAQTGPLPAARLAERVLQAFSVPFAVGEHRVAISASIGHATTTEPLNPAELMRRADMAMYGAKDAGKHRALEYRTEMERRTGSRSAPE
jgi:diguanylate cyclase (GGDEF)-like protein